MPWKKISKKQVVEIFLSPIGELIGLRLPELEFELTEPYIFDCISTAKAIRDILNFNYYEEILDYYEGNVIYYKIRLTENATSMLYDALEEDSMYLMETYNEEEVTVTEPYEVIPMYGEVEFAKVIELSCGRKRL